MSIRAGRLSGACLGKWFGLVEVEAELFATARLRNCSLEPSNLT